ncbi:MAG: hypothetical protein WCT23_00450 [Candidatus Neomarinimicrobiota bacterium]|jgi:hypothetical protein
MKKNLILAFIAMFLLLGCFETPPSIYTPIDPDVENAKTPVITAIDKDVMWTGETLTITGKNFSDSTDCNIVYFSEVSEPVIGDTTIVIDSSNVNVTYTISNPLKEIKVTTDAYLTTVEETIDGVTTKEEYMEAVSVEAYTVMDTNQITMVKIEATPVFTQMDTLDTLGYVNIVRTETTYGSISDWMTHSHRLGTVIEASATELKVMPPEIEVVNALITVHVQNAIAPAKWGYIDLMVKP